MNNISISIGGLRFDFAGGKSQALELAHYLANSLYQYGDPVKVGVSEEFTVDPTDTQLSVDMFPLPMGVYDQEGAEPE